MDGKLDEEELRYDYALTIIEYARLPDASPAARQIFQKVAVLLVGEHKIIMRRVYLRGVGYCRSCTAARVMSDARRSWGGRRERLMVGNQIHLLSQS